MSKFLKRLVGTFSLRVGTRPAPQDWKLNLQNVRQLGWGAELPSGATLNFLSHIMSWRYDICISQRNPILARENMQDLWKALGIDQQKSQIFLVHEMASLEPISVKNALYEQCFAAASISSPFFI